MEGRPQLRSAGSGLGLRIRVLPSDAASLQPHINAISLLSLREPPTGVAFLVTRQAGESERVDPQAFFVAGWIGIRAAELFDRFAVLQHDLTSPKEQAVGG